MKKTKKKSKKNTVKFKKKLNKQAKTKYFKSKKKTN